MTMGTRRFQRAVSRKDLLIGISRPELEATPTWLGSYKFVFRRDCALEATRTQVALKTLTDA